MTPAVVAAVLVLFERAFRTTSLCICAARLEALDARQLLLLFLDRLLHALFLAHFLRDELTRYACRLLLRGQEQVLQLSHECSCCVTDEP